MLLESMDRVGQNAPERSNVATVEFTFRASASAQIPSWSMIFPAGRKRRTGHGPAVMELESSKLADNKKGTFPHPGSMGPIRLVICKSGYHQNVIDALQRATTPSTPRSPLHPGGAKRRNYAEVDEFASHPFAPT